MAQSLLQEPVQSYEDSNGKPLNGGQLFTYSAGTLTPKATYQDQAGTIPNTNPVILNERGEATVYGSGNYRMILKNSVGATIWDRDNVASIDSQIDSSSNLLRSDLANTSDAAKGDALVGVKQPATGAVARTQHQKNQDLYSVKDFGAKGDGTTDDAAAFQAMAIALGYIYAPAGTYILNSGITITDKQFRIYGDGPGVTELRFGTVTTGITFSASASWYTISVADILITTSQSGVGVGLSATWPEDFFDRFDLRAGFNNVQFRGADFVVGNSHGTASGWNKAVVLNNFCNVAFNDCSFKGQGGNPFANTQAANTVCQMGVQLNGRYSPVDAKFVNCYWNSWQQGIDVEDTVEGVQLVSCTMVSVLQGVRWKTGLWSLNYPTDPGGNAAGRPQLAIVNSHINCYQNAVWTDGVVSLLIYGNLFYHIDTATQVGDLISIENSNDNNIFGNQFWSFNTAFGTNGIVLQSNCKTTDVRDNRFVSSGTGSIGFSSAVWTKAGAQDNLVRGITTSGNFSADVIFDQGTRTRIGESGTFVATTSAVSIPNSSGTAVPLVVVYDPLGFQTSSTRLTVPNDKGVKKVRLTGQAVFDANGTGVRQLEIRKNGATFSGGGIVNRVPIGGSNSDALGVSTADILVSDGDYFELVATQSSGGALNVQASLTWLCLEVLS